MARYKATAPQALVQKIKEKATIANRAAAQALNKAATYTTDQSVRMITDDVNLQPQYIKKHLRVVGRASPANLRTVIAANERATLLTRYPHMRTSQGMRVAVNKGSGFREIKGAFAVTGLRGSQASGIALSSRDAVDFFKLGLNKGQRTPAKSRKLQRIISKARTKPRSIEVLHSRSINQMFTSVRNLVKPKAEAFLIEDFLTQLNRLKSK